MVNQGPPQTPHSVAEALGTGAIPADLAAILAAHSRTVREDGTARTPEERSGRGIHSFLAHLALGEVPVSGLERVTLVGVDPDGRLHLMHSLFSVRFNLYSTECRLFACLGKLPVEGLPPRWWRYLLISSRKGALFALCRAYITSHTWEGSPCSIGRQIHAIGPQRRKVPTKSTWLVRGWLSFFQTARIGFLVGRLKDLPTSLRRRRVCSPC